MKWPKLKKRAIDDTCQSSSIRLENKGLRKILKFFFKASDNNDAKPKLNKVKVGIVIAVFIVIIAGIVTLAVTCTTITIPKSEATKVYTDFMEYVKTGDFDKAAALTTNSEISTNDIFDEEFDEIDVYQILSLLTSKLEYTIGDINLISSDEITINSTITNSDITKILADFYEKIRSDKFSSLIEGKTIEKQNELYIKQLNDVILNTSIDTMSDTINVVIKKKDNKWLVNCDGRLLRAIFAGKRKEITGIGDTIITDDFEMTLSEVKACSKLDTKVPLKEETGMQYLVMMFDINNTSNKTLVINKDFCFAFVDSDKVNTQTTQGDIDGYGEFGKEISADSKEKQYLVYKVNQDWSEFVFCYDEGSVNKDFVGLSFSFMPGEVTQ